MSDQATISAVYAVGAMAVAATRATDEAIAQSARCIAEIVEQRRKLGLPLDLAIPELRQLHLGLGHSLNAREAAIAARLGLVRVPATLGVSDFGQDCPCEGIAADPAQERKLKVVGVSG